MPLYEYRCTECGTEYEELVKNSAQAAPACPKCTSTRTEKKMSRFGNVSSSGDQSCAYAPQGSCSSGSCSSCCGI